MSGVANSRRRVVTCQRLYDKKGDRKQRNLALLATITPHISQLLDVAVYKKMKIESARVISQTKMVKYDLCVSKKQVSAILKIIFEKSMTMECISEVFGNVASTPPI